MKNVAAKTRKVEQPYAWWVSPHTGWKYVLLKSWQADNSKPHARWFMWIEGYCNEYGDTYCPECRPALNHALPMAQVEEGGDGNGWFWFDQTVWPTVGEFLAWAWGEQ